MSSSKKYTAFSSKFEKDGKTIGYNFIGVNKAKFPFQMKVYYDLPLAINDKTITFKSYSFMNLSSSNVYYGILSKKVRKNNQDENCVNFYINAQDSVPTIDLDKDVTILQRTDLLSNIEQGLAKTKEFYANHPPLQTQEVKVFETTIAKDQDGSFIVNNLTNKYFNGNIEFNVLNNPHSDIPQTNLSVIYFPFDGKNKNILVPKKDIIDNKDGSFSVKFTKNNYLTIPAKNLKEIKAFDYLKLFDSWTKTQVKPNTSKQI